MVEVIDEAADDGEVLAADETPEGAVTLTVARPPVTRFLEAFTPVAGSPSTGVIDISGVPTPRALYDYSCYDPTFEYDLGRDFRQFQATLGISDNSPTDERTRFEVFLDGTSSGVFDLGFGESVPITIDTTGTLRLTLVATQLVGDCNDGLTIWGDARVLGVPSEVPAPDPIG